MGHSRITRSQRGGREGLRRGSACSAFCFQHSACSVETDGGGGRSRAGSSKWAVVIIQARDDYWLGPRVETGGVWEQRWDSSCIVKHLLMDRKGGTGGVSRMTQCFGLNSSYKDGTAINEDGVACGRSRFGGTLRNSVLGIFKFQWGYRTGSCVWGSGVHRRGPGKRGAYNNGFLRHESR